MPTVDARLRAVGGSSSWIFSPSDGLICSRLRAFVGEEALPRDQNGDGDLSTEAPRRHHGDVHEEMAVEGATSGEDISFGMTERVGTPVGRKAGARMKEGDLDGETI